MLDKDKGSEKESEKVAPEKVDEEKEGEVISEE